MYRDKQCVFSDDQSLVKTYVATPVVFYSTNTYELGSAARQIGPGELVRVRWRITTALVGASSTLAVALVNDTDGAGDSAVVLYDTGALAVGTWVIGYGRTWAVPQVLTLAHLTMRYTVDAATTTAGAINAEMIWDEQSNYNDWTAETGR